MEALHSLCIELSSYSLRYPSMQSIFAGAELLNLCLSIFHTQALPVSKPSSEPSDAPIGKWCKSSTCFAHSKYFKRPVGAFALHGIDERARVNVLTLLKHIKM